MENVPNLWELNETEAFALVKSPGAVFNVLTKRGKVKRVKTSKRSGLSGGYVTFPGAEWLSLMDEYKLEQIPRAKNFGYL